MPKITPEELNAVMEFDHVIRVHVGGTVTDSPESPYMDLNVAPDGTDEFDMSEGWQLLTGFTSQYGYRGPVMHPSEFIGSGMAREILGNPGDYVVVEVSARCNYTGETACDEETGCDCEPAGWAVAFKAAQ